MKKIFHYNKGWLALAGGSITTILVSMGLDAEIAAAVMTVVTGLAVALIPNAESRD